MEPASQSVFVAVTKSTNQSNKAGYTLISLYILDVYGMLSWVYKEQAIIQRKVCRTNFLLSCSCGCDQIYNNHCHQFGYTLLYFLSLNLNKLDWLVVLTACLVVNVSSDCDRNKILADKAGRYCSPGCLARLPGCRPACLVGLPALLACLPFWPDCLFDLTALLACLPCWPACLVGLPILLACLPCWPFCLVLCPLLALALVEVDFFKQLLYLDIYE